jgi:hypothetical protein
MHYLLGMEMRHQHQGRTDMTTTYRIYSWNSGHDFGSWPGENELGAYNEMLREAGYESVDDVPSDIRVEAGVDCQCGAVYGEQCQDFASEDTGKWVDYLERSYRASALAANCDLRHNDGWSRLRVAPECAERILADEGDFAQSVDVYEEED